MCVISIHSNLKIQSLKPLRWAEGKLSIWYSMIVYLLVNWILISKLKPTWSWSCSFFKAIPSSSPSPPCLEFGFPLFTSPLVMYCGSDNTNGLCPTWSSECIVPLLTDPRSVWCVKSIYLNLFACIGIWRHASCFHLMFFVLNTDKQACFCTPLSSGLFSFQPIFYAVDFFRKKMECVTFLKNNFCLNSL